MGKPNRFASTKELRGLEARVQNLENTQIALARLMTAVLATLVEEIGKLEGEEDER